MTYTVTMVQVADIIGNNLILPLSIGVLWTASKQNNEIQSKWRLGSVIYQPDIDDETIKEISKHDMVCFSTYVWNAEHHIKIAERIKRQNPNCFLVFGGPHFNERWQNFWTQFGYIVDLVLLGDGEESFLNLLMLYPDHDKIYNIPGAWTQNHFSGLSSRVDVANYHISPYLDGFFDSIVKYSHNSGLTVQAVIQTNKGCPYHCSFCEEGKEYKNKIYKYPIDKIFQEIEWCGKNQVEYLTIGDDNLGIFDRDIDIVRYICSTSLKYGFPKILDATYAKNNPKNVLAISQIDKEYDTKLIRGITVALQSNNSKTLHAIKRFNLIEDKQREYIKALKNLGMPIYAEIIWPLPFETYDSLCSGIDSIIDQGIDIWIGMYPLSMQSSADLYHDHKDRYQFAITTTRENNFLKSHVKMNAPISSDWADHERVVQGHVFYMWLTGLYFFGFARPAIDFLKKTQKTSVTESINDILDQIETLETSNSIKIQHGKLREFWKNWLTYQSSVNLGMFDGQNMDFWYPYTHHASWLQINHNTWLEFLKEWLRTKQLSQDELENILGQCEHEVVKFSKKYPYETNQQHTVTLNHKPPEFKNLLEFCRYYYWYNRKRGYSRASMIEL